MASGVPGELSHPAVPPVATSRERRQRKSGCLGKDGSNGTGLSIQDKTGHFKPAEGRSPNGPVGSSLTYCRDGDDVCVEEARGSVGIFCQTRRFFSWLQGSWCF
jgi:hypothetical protein